MNCDFKIIDFNECHAQVVDDMEKEQWGVWNDDGIKGKVNQGSIVKLAKFDNEIAGVSYYRPIGDLLYYQAIVIKPKFQHMSLGSLFMDDALSFAKERGLKSVFCEAIIVDDEINALNLLTKYNFKEVLRVRNYWGGLYPHVECAECGCKPCQCGCAFFVKNL